VVMTRGRAVQMGSAEALFERPQHMFVGHFIGSPGMNFLPAACCGPLAPSGATTLGVRPEYLSLVAEGASGALPAQVVAVQDIGTYWLLQAGVSGASGAPVVLRARLPRERAVPQPGQTVWLQVAGPHTCYYGADERLIGEGSA